MPTLPEIQQLTATSPQILNSIRNGIGGTYKDMIPEATNTIESIREIGGIMQQYQPLQNAFMSALVNRIGRVILTSKMYSNPWSMFKKGMLEYGETIEEIFVNLAKPHQYDEDVAENEVFKREKPDVRATFHSMNFQKFYKTTVNQDQLKQAFLSWQGITDLIAKIIDALYTGANYDEFITMKYMLGRAALSGNIKPVTIPTVNTTNAKSIISTIKGISNNLEYLKTDFNEAKVSTHTQKADQFIILNSEFEAMIDVEVLASAFNMSKAEFMGNRVGVDSFADVDSARLSILFKDDPTYVPFSTDEINLLKTIPAIIVDRDWFMIFDNMQNMTEQYNGEGLYWNYWYHTWKTFSASPFCNAVIFTTETPTVTSVTVTPETASVKKGSSLQLSADVVATGFAETDVVWMINEKNSTSTISPSGKLTVASDETNVTLNVYACSVFDNNKTDFSVITVTE